MSIKGLFDDVRDYITMRPEPIVREFVENFDWSLNQRNLTSNSVPVASHLTGGDAHSSGAEQRLLKSLTANLENVHWGQRYDPTDLGQHFYENYGFVEMMGLEGHFDSDSMACGFYVQAPNMHYPTHRHVAEEIYIPLTNGALWSRENGSFEEHSAGDIIHHESNESHAMENLAIPLVALYFWRDGDLVQKPEF